MVCRYGVPDLYENSVQILSATTLAGAGYLDSRQRGRGRQLVHRAVALKPTMSKHRSGHQRYGVYFLFSRFVFNTPCSPHHPLQGLLTLKPKHSSAARYAQSMPVHGLKKTSCLSTTTPLRLSESLVMTVYMRRRALGLLYSAGRQRRDDGNSLVALCSVIMAEWWSASSMPGSTRFLLCSCCINRRLQPSSRCSRRTPSLRCALEPVLSPRR